MARVATSTLSIVNVGYRSTNIWVISVGTSRLLLDLGWPGTLATLQANLSRMGVPQREIRYGLATHYHIDHAGLAQDLKNGGMRLLVADCQVEWIPRLKAHIKPTDQFTEIALHDNRIFTLAESRAILDTIGLAGHVLHTPGHSPDSVSLLLDDGRAFTGDLTHPLLITDEERAVTEASWHRLRDRGATTVYAGHGPIRSL